MNFYLSQQILFLDYSKTDETNEIRGSSMKSNVFYDSAIDVSIPFETYLRL